MRIAYVGGSITAARGWRVKSQEWFAERFPKATVNEIHADQPDRSPVAFRLKDPETELKSPKYQGTNLRVSQILLLGDLVP